MNTLERKLRHLIKRCDTMWKDMGGPDLLENGDIRFYTYGGMWLHPCGKTYQEGGRDGFDTDHGDMICPCQLCSTLREALLQEGVDVVGEKYLED